MIQKLSLIDMSKNTIEQLYIQDLRGYVRGYEEPTKYKEINSVANCKYNSSPF